MNILTECKWFILWFYVSSDQHHDGVNGAASRRAKHCQVYWLVQNCVLDKGAGVWDAGYEPEGLLFSVCPLASVENQASYSAGTNTQQSDTINALHTVSQSNTIFCKLLLYKVATALSALERIELIHADIHAKNIMLVDHRSEPLRVKLIDFGTAVHKSDEDPNMSHQIYSYR